MVNTNHNSHGCVPKMLKTWQITIYMYLPWCWVSKITIGSRFKKSLICCLVSMCIQIYFICCMCLTGVNWFHIEKNIHGNLYFLYVVISECMFIWLRSCNPLIIKIRAGKEEQHPNGFNHHVPLILFHCLCETIKYGKLEEGGPMIHEPFLPWHIFCIHRKKRSWIK